MKHYIRLFLFVKKNTFLIFLCVLLNIISGAGKSIGAIYLERITDALESNHLDNLLVFILIGGVLTFLSYVFRWLGAIIPRYLMEKFSYEIRITLLKHLKKISFLTFEKYSAGELQSLIQNDTIKAGQIFYTIFSRLLNNIFLFIFSVWVMMLTDVKAAVTTVIIVLSAAVTNQLILKRMKKYEKEVQHSLGEMTQSLESIFKGMEIVKTFWSKELVQSHYLNKQQEYCRNRFKSARINAVRTLWYTFIENLCLYSSVAYLGCRGINGAMSIGEVLMFIYLIKQIIMPVEVTFRWMSTLPMSFASWERILQKLNINVEKINYKSTGISADINHVEIENLSFSYERNLPIFNNFNLSLEKGKITGLFGSSGTGKTTLLKILSGLYLSTQIIYKINGKKIDSLKPYITYASLERSIFPMTIYENISLGAENIHPEDVKELLAKLGFENWLSALPGGIDTTITSEDMSGGQKQALSTVRALLSGRPIIILDEPFSALDLKKAELLSDILKKEKENRIILITSHRSDKSNLFDLEINL